MSDVLVAEIVPGENIIVSVGPAKIFLDEFRSFGITWVGFRYAGSPLKKIEVDNVSGKACVACYKDLKLEDLLGKLKMPNECHSKKNRREKFDHTDHFGVLCLTGSWKFLIGEENFNLLNDRFSLGLDYPKEVEKECTSVICVFSRDERENFKVMKIGKKEKLELIMSGVRDVKSLLEEKT